MKVNIRGEWYDSEKEPIAIEITKSDKENIKNMSQEATMYVSFPNKLKWPKVTELLKLNKI